MRTVVINTGTEILLGDVVNTHLAFIAREIFPLGLRIDYQIAVPDGESIRSALIGSLKQAEIIIVTGGLGPTTDDITREVTAEVLGLELRQDANVMAAIAGRAGRRGFRLTDRTSRQANVPAGATVLPNEFGSAPGLYLRAGHASEANQHLFLLPGPPRELRPMFRSAVIPLLQRLTASSSVTSRKTYRITGIGESIVEEAVGERLLAISGIELGYCARPGEVDLRIIGQQTVLDQADAIVMAALGHSIFSNEGRDLEEVVVELLRNAGKKLAVAESCTGGYLAHRITKVPGASNVFLAGYLTYSNEAKTRMLRVKPELITQHGAVSLEVVCAMAEGALGESGANVSLGTTGIAGPSGATPNKPVGTVFIALASESTATQVKRFSFHDDRQTFKELASQAALEMLRQFLL
jgi:nicotinamide-nucleotide amidase